MAGSADELILVSTQTIPALHQCKTSIEMLHDLGIDEDRIRIILNQNSDEDPLSQKDIEKVFGVQIQAILPHSPQDLYDACMKKQLPSVTGPYRTTLTAVARKMAGMPEEAPKRSLLSLGSLKDRFQRKTVKNVDSIAS